MQSVDMAWLGWIASRLDGLAHEIRRQRQREPDPGDLLIILASARDTVVGELMSNLGLDLDQIAQTLETLRAAHAERDPISGSRRCVNKRSSRKRLRSWILPVTSVKRSAA